MYTSCNIHELCFKSVHIIRHYVHISDIIVHHNVCHNVHIPYAMMYKHYMYEYVHRISYDVHMLYIMMCTHHTKSQNYMT